MVRCTHVAVSSRVGYYETVRVMRYFLVVEVKAVDKILGVGIAGFGFIGKVHAYCHLNMPFFYDPPPLRTRLVGVATSRPETAEKARRLLGFTFATTDLATLVARDDIHIIHCCLPNHMHKPLLLEAIRHGKHIYCDKPLAFNAAEADEILAAMEAYNYRGVHQMTFQNRFLPATLRARQLVEEGLLGRVLSFRGVYLHAGYVDPARPMSWRLDRKQGGGGALYDLGSHILDLLWWLLGDFANVSALTETFTRERPRRAGAREMVPVEVDDIALMMLRLKRGGVGTVETSRVATGTNDELRFEIHGTQGALRFNLMEPNWLEVYDQRAPEEPLGGRRGFTRIETVQRYPPPAAFPGPKFSPGWLRAHVACLHHFLSCIAEGKDARPSLRDGAYVQRVMDRAYESAAAQGRWMAV